MTAPTAGEKPGVSPRRKLIDAVVILVQSQRSEAGGRSTTT